MDEKAAAPRELVSAHPVELTPSLIENALVKPGFLSDVSPRIYNRPLSRCTHVLHFQVFEHQNAVSLGDQRRDLVEIVMSHIGYLCVNAPDIRFLLPPVVRSLDHPRELPLSVRQLLLVLSEAVQRLEHRPVREREKSGYAEITAHERRSPLDGIGHLDRGLDRDVPFPGTLLDRYVLYLALDLTALVEPHPSDLRQVHPAIVDLEALWISKGVLPAVLLLELREILERLFGVEEVVKSPAQVHELLLESLRMGFIQKRGLRVALPCQKVGGHRLVALDALPLIESLFLNGEGLVPNEPAAPGCTPDEALDRGVRLEPENEALADQQTPG